MGMEKRERVETGVAPRGTVDRSRCTFVSNYQRIIVVEGGSNALPWRTIIISTLAIIIARVAINSCPSWQLIYCGLINCRMFTGQRQFVTVLLDHPFAVLQNRLALCNPLRIFQHLDDI